MADTTIAQLKRDALASIVSGQCEWAERRRIPLERSDYTREADDNVHIRLSPSTRQRFEKASGSELKRTWRGARPPKFHALKSSSALAYNVFEYWRTSLGVLSQALRSHRTFERMELEAKYPTGCGGICNLDVELKTGTGDWTLAVEAKFTEPFELKKKSGLQPVYSPSDGQPTAWKKRGLLRCDEIVRSVTTDKSSYAFLDVVQLLKHILGLNKKLGQSYRLLYLWYDVGGEAGIRHQEEVREFKDALGSEVDFDSMTYQSLVGNLKRLSAEDADASYFDYLEDRYQLG